MANKLRDIFSDDDFNVNCKLKFENNEAYKNFLSALELVQTEGRVVPVKGITSITESIHDQTGNYPLGEQEHITEFFIGPSIESHEIEIQVNGVNKKISFQRYQTTECFILRTVPDSIVYFEFTFFKKSHKHNMTYRIQFEKATSLVEVVQAFEIAEGILARVYKSDGELSADGKTVTISDVRKSFRYSTEFFKHLSSIAEKFELSITPEMLNDISDEIRYDVEELYLLACKNKVLRLNAKLNSAEATSISMMSPNDSLHVGDPIKLSFLGDISFQIFDKTITLFTANLLLDAVVKEIQNTGDDLKILYGDTDSKPMYISYMAFINKDDAEQELESLFEHEDNYIHALTKNEYIKNYLQ